MFKSVATKLQGAEDVKDMAQARRLITQLRTALAAGQQPPEFSFSDIEEALTDTSLDRSGCQVHDDGRFTVTAAWVHDFARNLRPTAPQQHTQAALSDDAIYNFWLYRDCMDAIRAGDMRAQFISAVRAILAASQQPAPVVDISQAYKEAITALTNIMADSLPADMDDPAEYAHEVLDCIATLYPNPGRVGLTATIRSQSPADAAPVEAKPVATVISRAGDDFRVGWIRPENVSVGTMLYAAQPSPAQGEELSQQAAWYRELRDSGHFVVGSSGIGWTTRFDDKRSTPEELDAAMERHMQDRVLVAKPAEGEVCMHCHKTPRQFPEICPSSTDQAGFPCWVKGGAA